MDTASKWVVKHIPEMTYADLMGFAEGIQQSLVDYTEKEIDLNAICEALLSTSASWLETIEEDKADQ